MKRAVLLFVLTFMVFGCGYKTVLTKSEAAFSVHLASVTNSSDEMGVRNILEDEVLYYLASINSIKPKKTADYTATIDLKRMKSSAAVTLKSGESATANLNLVINIKLKDKSGNYAINRDYSASNNYDQHASLSDTKSDKEKALKKSIIDIMNDMRHDIERR